jgi:choline/glycine/proline betaine transport protein
MTIFGDTAIHMILNEGVKDLASIINQDTSLALFAFLEHFPFSGVVTSLASTPVWSFACSEF